MFQGSILIIVVIIPIIIVIITILIIIVSFLVITVIINNNHGNNGDSPMEWRMFLYRLDCSSLENKVQYFDCVLIFSTCCDWSTRGKHTEIKPNWSDPCKLSVNQSILSLSEYQRKSKKKLI